MVGEETWRLQGDIRDVISLSKLVKKHDGPAEISEIIRMLAKYGMGSDRYQPAQRQMISSTCNT